ncbi:putative bifunctional diguanylate cyclase/phosphodiesterase [Syntrophotalea carbinolica]|nr:EAL domain-containing protein [Syntrophotalea carbinolica]
MTPRILIVDDNQSIHDDFKKILTKKNAADTALDDLEAALFGDSNQSFSAPDYIIDFACQGQEALAMVEQAESEEAPYSLAFVDGRMPPGWDGIETIVHLWKASPELQIVLCTAYADYTWDEIQHKLGDTDSLVILKKPFDIAEVLQLAHTMTRKWELNRQIQGRLHRLAYFDNLTGLPNRTQFLESLNKTLAIAQRKQKQAALLFIDLNDFKRINDTLGHSMGDKLLEIVAKRLAGCIRESDLLGSTCEGSKTARLGGDEFTVLLPEVESEQFVATVAKRIFHCLTRPADLDKHQVMVTPSIGIALFPNDGKDAETLMKCADMAMYFAKNREPENYRFYQESMNTEALKRLAIETQLRHALQRQELSLVYQPQFDLNTGAVSGLEALLRWDNQELGQIPPKEFILIAEETGIIYDLGHWVMCTACNQVKTWHNMDIELPRISVNVSPKEFIHPDFLSNVKTALDESGLEPGGLQIEITETLLMEHYEGTAKILEELSRMGVQIAIDDFGKGYSSLNRLHTLTIDCLKIDRSFVNGISVGFKEQSVIKAIISMASAMNLKVIAEGVETENQFTFLKDKHCQEAQGYRLSLPLTTEQAEYFLRKTKTSEISTYPGQYPPGLPCS